MRKTAQNGGVKSLTKQDASTRGRWKKTFLSVLRKSANVTRAAEAAGIDRSVAYGAKSSDKKFAALWEDALEQAADLLEEEATRRAFEGCQRPIYQGGKLVGYVTEYSDTLMCLLLKAHKPARFRERSETQINMAEIPVQYIEIEATVDPGA